MANPEQAVACRASVLQRMLEDGRLQHAANPALLQGPVEYDAHGYCELEAYVDAKPEAGAACQDARGHRRRGCDRPRGGHVGRRCRARPIHSS